MIEYENAPPPARISLLDYLQQHGWKIVRDNGREEVAGLCPLHRDSRPSFYVNRRKQVFYCHGCGRGGGLARLVHWLEEPTESGPYLSTEEELLEQTYCFYQRQLMEHDDARAYLARRGIHDTDVIGRMRIGYAPGACLRGFLAQLGYPRQGLVKRGLIDARHGRDCFFRCLTFPLVEGGSLYGRSIDDGICRHRFLPGSKGGLYEWPQSQHGSRLILVEGLLDVAALWQSGFIEANTALGSHLNNLQLSQLCQSAARLVYICFDADRNGSGQRAARNLSIQLRHAGVEALRVALPEGHDPASLFAAGGTGADFQRCLDRARP
jgi:DNA primase